MSVLEESLIITSSLFFDVQSLQTFAKWGMDFPKWVFSLVCKEWTIRVFDHELMKLSDIEEEMFQLIQIALACIISSV